MIFTVICTYAVECDRTDLILRAWPDIRYLCSLGAKERLPNLI